MARQFERFIGSLPVASKSNYQTRLLPSLWIWILARGVIKRQFWNPLARCGSTTPSRSYQLNQPRRPPPARDTSTSTSPVFAPVLSPSIGRLLHDSQALPHQFAIEESGSYTTTHRRCTLIPRPSALEKILLASYLPYLPGAWEGERSGERIERIYHISVSEPPVKPSRNRDTLARKLE